MTLSRTVTQSLYKEITSLQSRPRDGIRIEFNEADMLNVRGWVEGPAGTPFEGGYFLVTFDFTHEYPAAPPRCRMATKIYHPNVSSTGEICVSTLKKDWKPTYGIGHILTVIKCLLISPNPDSALNPEAARDLQEAYDEYASVASLWTNVHAAPSLLVKELFKADEARSDVVAGKSALPEKVSVAKKAAPTVSRSIRRL